MSSEAPLRVEPAVARLSEVRALVPSPRELGEQPASPTAVLELGASTRRMPSPRELAATFARQLNVREITADGPLLPLMMLGYLTLVQRLDESTMILLLPNLQVTFGFSLSFYLFMAAVFGLMKTILLPLVGYVADRTRRVALFTIGAVITHATIAIRGTSVNVGQLVGWSAVNTVGVAINQPMGYPLMTDYYPPRSRARVFAFATLALAVAGAVSPLIGGIAATALGWRATLEILGGIATIASLTGFLLKEPVRGAQDRLAAGAPAEIAAKEQRPLGWGEAWRACASVRTQRIVWATTPFTAAAGQAILPITANFYATRFHLDVLQRGTVGSLALIPGIVGIIIAAPITDRILSYKPGRLMPIIGVFGLVTVVGYLVLALTPFLWLAIAINTIPAFFNIGIYQAQLTVTSLVLPPRIRGLGLQSGAPFILAGQLIAYPLGLIAQGDLAAGIVAVAAVHAIGSVIFLFGGGSVEHDIRAARAASLADEAAREAKAAGLSKLLIVRDLDVVYDGAQVLFGVDLDVEEGEMLALLGTNGAGKSTLLRAVAGVQHAANGAIFLDGDDITHLPPQEMAGRGLILMPGGQAVFPTLTVRQNLDAGGWLYRDDPAYLKRKTEEVLERFPRLRERLHTRAGDLSGGEQQMVALGQALLMKPRLLMIDELSLGLAPQVVEMLLEVLRDINRQGTTVILVEQSINVALQVAQRAVYMEKGEVRFDGSVAELMSRPDVVRSVFLGGAATAGRLAQAASRLLEGDARETVLEVDRVSLQYGGVRVLEEVSLAVARNEVVGLVGPNGAGKTSLFDVITGFARPQAGTVRVLDRDVTGLAPDARARLGVARSYQNVRLFPALTVRENIAVALSRHLSGGNAVLAAVWSPPTQKVERRVSRRVENLVESLGLGAYADKFVNELSTGTRRILDIACLLAAQPRLLLLDEPSSGLAQAETEQLGPVIQRVVKETGCAVLVIEHDIGLVAAVSHRLLAMRLGSVMAEGTPEEVLGNAEVIEALLGGASEAVLSRSVALEPR